MIVDIDILIKHKLTISSYLLACFVYEKETENLVKYVSNCGKFSKKDVKDLVAKEYLVYTGDDDVIGLHELYSTDKLKDLILQMKPVESSVTTVETVVETVEKELVPEGKPSDLDKLALEFRECFPTNVRPNGKPVKSPLRDIKKQLSKFKKEYKEYTDEEIVEAAKNYVDRYRLCNYQFMRTAQYFIHKQHEGSDLAAEIDAIKDKGKTPKKIGYGRKVQ